jgi:hypothetical protein
VWRNYLQKQEGTGLHYRFNDQQDFSDLIASVGADGRMPLYLLLDSGGYLVEVFNWYREWKAYLAAGR